MTWTIVVMFLLVLGFVLLAIELLVIPGFGVIGILGIVSVMAAGGFAYGKLGTTYGVLAFGGGIGVTILMFWLLPRTAAGKAMVLSENQAGMRAADARLAELAGKEGRALTPLRPAGTAEIADRTVDVVTDGVYVEAGARVRVAKVEGVRVVVEPVGNQGE